MGAIWQAVVLGRIAGQHFKIALETQNLHRFLKKAPPIHRPLQFPARRRPTDLRALQTHPGPPSPASQEIVTARLKVCVRYSRLQLYPESQSPKPVAHSLWATLNYAYFMIHGGPLLCATWLPGGLNT